MFMENFIEPELTFIELQYEEIITQSGDDPGAGAGGGWELENPQDENEENSPTPSIWP